jgi:hypothetical protein
MPSGLNVIHDSIGLDGKDFNRSANVYCVGPSRATDWFKASVPEQQRIDIEPLAEIPHDRSATPFTIYLRQFTITMATSTAAMLKRNNFTFLPDPPGETQSVSLNLISVPANKLYSLTNMAATLTSSHPTEFSQLLLRSSTFTCDQTVMITAAVLVLDSLAFDPTFGGTSVVNSNCSVNLSSALTVPQTLTFANSARGQFVDINSTDRYQSIALMRPPTGCSIIM